MIFFESLISPSDPQIGARLRLEGMYQFEPSDSIRILGRNGAGKTTLLRIIAGLETDYGGVRRVDSSATFRLIPTNIMDLLLPWYSVRKNTQILLGTNNDTMGRFTLHIENLLPDFYERVSGRPVHTLSAGQKAAIVCAWALASRPTVILLDETLAYMDNILAERVSIALTEFQSQGGILFFAGHNAPNALAWTHTLTVEASDVR